jgi:hypothetical protein
MNIDLKYMNSSSQKTINLVTTSPLMLALYTFKHSERAITTALEKAGQCERFVIVFGCEVNFGLYIMESDIGLYPSLKARCEKELLLKLEKEWKERTEDIARMARTKCQQVVTYVRAGYFVSLCMEVIEKEKPFLIVTTRSCRPPLINMLFRSPADRLVSLAGCPVIEA